MDPNDLHFAMNDTAPVNVKPLAVEEPIAVQRNLLGKVSRLKQAALSIQKCDSAQKGKSLVQEYQLRTELGALCEDVLFLGDKRDRLAENLKESCVKNTELRNSSTKTITNNNNNSNKDNENDMEDIRVADASVQTENWPIDYSERPHTPELGFEITPRLVIPTQL